MAEIRNAEFLVHLVWSAELSWNKLQHQMQCWQVPNPWNLCIHGTLDWKGGGWKGWEEGTRLRLINPHKPVTAVWWSPLWAFVELSALFVFAYVCTYGLVHTVTELGASLLPSLSVLTSMPCSCMMWHSMRKVMSNSCARAWAAFPASPVVWRANSLLLSTQDGWLDRSFWIVSNIQPAYKMGG